MIAGMKIGPKVRLDPGPSPRDVALVSAGLQSREGCVVVVAQESLDLIRARCPLSPRELQMLHWIAEGYPSRRIAKVLGITQHTVHFHINALMTKANVNTRAQAIALAFRKGWIS